MMMCIKNVFYLIKLHSIKLYGVFLLLNYRRRAEFVE